MEETSASGDGQYNTYYGSFSDGTGVYNPAAKFAAGGEVIINQESSGYELPMTGGIGTQLFTALGAVLASGAGAVRLQKKRKEE